jgi:hypothetical protein
VGVDEVNSVSLDNLLNLAHRLPIEPAAARYTANRETCYLRASAYLGVRVPGVFEHTDKAGMARALKLDRKIQQDALRAIEATAADQLKDLH